MQLPRRPLGTATGLCRSGLRAGFTLIELLAAMLILGILMAFLIPKIPEAIEQAKITASKKNLQEIYGGLLQYEGKFEKLPGKEDSGVRFFACLIYDKVWENTKGSAKKLTCPGVSTSALATDGLPEEEWFVDRDIIDGGYSAYAGRNNEEFPLRKLSGKQPLVATDNDPEMNFESTTLVLYGDGRVDSIELATLMKQGILAEDEEYLAVGPDSPLEDLRKLSLD